MLVGLFESFSGLGFKVLEECFFDLWVITVTVKESLSNQQFEFCSKIKEAFF